MLGTGTTVLLIVFLLTVLAYLGLLFYGKKLNEEAEGLKTEYAGRLNSFISGDSKRVLDFQNRLTISGELLAKERNNKGDMEKVEEAMITGVYLGAYKYDSKTNSIALDCYADNYEVVAKQILSFKKQAYFPAVLAGKTELDTQSGKVKFPVVLTIK